MSHGEIVISAHRPLPDSFIKELFEENRQGAR